MVSTRMCLHEDHLQSVVMGEVIEYPPLFCTVSIFCDPEHWNEICVDCGSSPWFVRIIYGFYPSDIRSPHHVVVGKSQVVTAQMLMVGLVVWHMALLIGYKIQRGLLDRYIVRWPIRNNGVSGVDMLEIASWCWTSCFWLSTSLLFLFYLSYAKSAVRGWAARYCAACLAVTSEGRELNALWLYQSSLMEDQDQLCVFPTRSTKRVILGRYRECDQVILWSIISNIWIEIPVITRLVVEWSIIRLCSLNFLFQKVWWLRK